MFNETNSFYFSWTGDLTNAVQRQQKQRREHHQHQTRKHQGASDDIRLIPLWRRVDDRFFWNKFMLKSVMEMFVNNMDDARDSASTTTNIITTTSSVVTPTNEKSPSIGDANDDRMIASFSHIWILPIIQGFVQIEKCFFDLNESSPVGSGHQKAFPVSQQQQTNETIEASVVDNNRKSNNLSDQLSVSKITNLIANDQLKQHQSKELLTTSFPLEDRDFYLMTLISRRSRFRAGTRYKKRGLDENGRCANYVETEQIFTYGSHTVSFVLVRGSVPLFWSQLGHKYRPPPRLERSEAENLHAFRRHFEQEFTIYEGDTVAVNLIEQTGREKILGDAFLDSAIKMDDARLVYVSFDFHDYWYGLL